jgi:membrane peptidoglycan carboxypeptidase
MNTKPYSADKTSFGVFNKVTGEWFCGFTPKTGVALWSIQKELAQPMSKLVAEGQAALFIAQGDDGVQRKAVLL